MWQRAVVRKMTLYVQQCGQLCAVSVVSCASSQMFCGPVLYLIVLLLVVKSCYCTLNLYRLYIVVSLGSAREQNSVGYKWREHSAPYIKKY